MKSPYALLRPSGLQELCLWTIPAPSVWTPPSPLVVPEVNPQDAALHTGIVANPNCSTIITVTAIAALNRLSPIRSMVASTYQAVSGAGVAGIGELHDQISALEAGRMPTVSAFPHQIAYNLIPPN